MCNKTETPEVEKQDNNIPYTHCLNCQTELAGPYCHHCGQQVSNSKPSVKEFILEYLNNAFLWDRNLFRTLWFLIRKPGFLTSEFLSGKVVSYMHPLKLNMFLLFVFITLFIFFAGQEKMTRSVNDFTSDERFVAAFQLNQINNDVDYLAQIKASPRDTVELSAPLALAKNYPEIIVNLETIQDTKEKGIDRYIAVIPHLLIEKEILLQNEEEEFYYFDPEKGREIDDLELARDLWSKLVDLTANYFPMIILFTTPFLSFALRLVRRKMHRSRFDHFIFALHYTALIELIIIFIFLLHLFCSPSMKFLERLFSISSCLYLTLAFRRVDNTKSWFRAICKALFTGLIYFIICMFALIVIFIATCFSLA